MTARAEEAVARAKKVLPERLRSLRRGQKLTLEQLSQMCGICKSSLEKYERGLAVPAMEKLIQLAAFYGVRMDWLLGGEW
jgi:transcriptional regulator with XRE-family HTH domain